MRAQRSSREPGHARAQDDLALSVERNSEYDPFAPIYNRYWGEEYRANVLPIVERLLLSRVKPRASVLDVCCGTGQFTQILRERGYEMAGLDASAGMIEFARRNAPDVPFTVADVRDFSLDRTFDAAYSVFESLNHVRDIEGLSMAFGCIHQHLSRGAPLLFDLNREEAFIEFWNNTDAIVTDDNVCVLLSDYDELTRVATCEVTVFDLDGQWRRNDFQVRQICHDIDAVAAALAGAGFRDISLHDARDAGMTGDVGHGRTFFLATA